MKNISNRFNITKNNRAAIIAGIIFAILSAVLGLVFGFYFSNSSKNLSYAVDEFRERKSTISINPRAKILFDNDEVNNIVVAEIAIWNSGSQTIDEKDILSLTIKPSQGIKILSADQIISSRKNLRFQTTLIKDENNLDVIGLNIPNDALETSDGGIIQIVYSGEINSDFFAEGRIKGIQNDFVKNDWDVVNTKKGGWGRGIFIFCGGIFLLALIIYVSISTFKDIFSSDSRIEKILIVVFALVMFPLFAFIAIQFISMGYQNLKAVYYLSWLAR